VKPTVSLHDIAPRLAKARDQYLAERAERSRIAVARASKLLELQRLVAHRELQLIRAEHTGNRRYIRERQDKLDSARRRLQTIERLAA
jgi:hypothetical protein